MTYPIPKWLQIRYAKLFKKFGEEYFTFSKAKTALNEKDEKSLNVVLSELRKAQWLEIKPSENDSRKKNYKLNNPEEIFLAINNQKNNKK